LEQELESLRRRKAIADSQNVSPIPDEKSPFDFLQQDNKSQPASPKAIEVIPSPKPQESNGSSSRTPSNSGSGGSKSDDPKGNDTKPTPPSILSNPQEPLKFQPQEPGKDILPPKIPGSTDSSTDLDIKLDDLTVPTITTGSLAPPSIDPKQIVSPERDLELNLSQIEIPSQLAKGQSNSAKITSAVQVVADKRIVDLVFNPALTRAVSFDEDNQDDGLYLVLLPKNEQGQFVPLPAAITIEAIDPSRDGAKSQIGRWNYSASEVEGKIQPIGSKQGIHLTLPWNGPNPKSDRIMVIATFQLENGRKLVARREIFVNNSNGLKTVWTPRASGGNSKPAGTMGTTPVISASAELPARESGQQIQTVGGYPAAESAPAPTWIPNSR
jgi:hypothetical protein